MNRNLSTLAIALIAGALAAGAVQTLFSARADQSERIPPTSGIYTGPQFSQKLGDGFRSVSTANKGATAPANVSGLSVDGLDWIDDSTTPWVMKRYINGNWAVIGAFDPTLSSYVGVIGGGVASINSATTTDLGSLPQANITINGTTTITGFGSSAPIGVVKIIRFAAALTLTSSSALPVPTGGYDLVTAANDRAIVTHLGSGAWEFTQYTRASGIPIDVSALGKAEFTFAEVPPLHVKSQGQALSRSSYPAFVAKTTRVMTGTRTSGNATIPVVGTTLGLKTGIPVEGSGINAGCTIASIVDNTSITLNSSACVTTSGSSSITAFPNGYGRSGNSTTVGIPDCRGRAMAGLDAVADDGGALAALLTTTANGFNANGRMLGMVGGSESQTLTLQQLPTGINSNAANSISVTSTLPYIRTVGVLVNVGNGGTPTGTAGQVGQVVTDAVASTNASQAIAVISNNTSGTAHPIVPPTLIGECVVRVTP